MKTDLIETDVDGTVVRGRTIESPLGPLRLLATDEALVGVRLPNHAVTDGVDELAEAAPGGDGSADPTGTHDPAREVLERAARQLDEYFAGRLRAFSVPLAMSGTPFQREVWRGLLTIPFGERRSYAWLADEIGRPRAYRAVGAANGSNPLGIIVPCHRVVGADGSLTGYGGGLDANRWLLGHERAVAGGARQPALL